MDPAARVIIIHHNRPGPALATAEAYRQSGAPCRIVIVDSGSGAEALHQLQRGPFEVLAIADNVGFGPGANAGLRQWLGDPAGEPFAIVGPHDGRPTPGCVRRVLAAMAERPRAALACAEYGPGEDFKPVVDKFFGGSFVPTRRGDGWEPVDYPHGTLLALRREAVEEIGLFDERFFAYCEEADIGIRAAKAGWEVGLVWGAVVANGRPPRADLSRYLQLRNTLLLLEKHFGIGTVAARLAWEVGTLAVGGAGPTLGVGLGEGRDDDPAAVRRAVRRASALAVRDYGRRRWGRPPDKVLAG